MSYYDKYMKYKNKYLELNRGTIMHGGMTLLTDEDRKHVITLIKAYNTLLPTVIDLEQKYDTYIKQIEILEQNRNDDINKYHRELSKITNDNEQKDTLKLLKEALGNLTLAGNALTTYVENTILNQKIPSKEINKKFNDAYYIIGPELRTFIGSINKMNADQTKTFRSIEFSPLTKHYNYDIIIVILKDLLKIKKEEL